MTNVNKGLSPNFATSINLLNASGALIQKPVNCSTNQLTGFYMKAILAFNGLSEFKIIS